MSKISAFSKIVLGMLKGDQALVIAGKNERTVLAELGCQSAGLNAEKVKAENAVENAKEAYKLAKYPTTEIGNSGDWYRRAVQAKESLDAAETRVKDLEASIKFANDLKTEYTEQVDKEDKA